MSNRDAAVQSAIDFLRVALPRWKCSGAVADCPHCNVNLVLSEIDRLRAVVPGVVELTDDETTIRDVIRSGGTDEDVEQQFRRAVWAKFPGHAINEPQFLRPARSMSMIGG